MIICPREVWGGAVLLGGGATLSGKGPDLRGVDSRENSLKTKVKKRYLKKR